MGFKLVEKMPDTWRARGPRTTSEVREALTESLKTGLPAELDEKAEGLDEQKKATTRYRAAAYAAKMGVSVAWTTDGFPVLLARKKEEEEEKVETPEISPEVMEAAKQALQMESKAAAKGNSRRKNTSEGEVAA